MAIRVSISIGAATAILISSQLIFSEPVQPNYSGRIALSYDGNYNDNDDIGGSAFAWGIIAAFGMQSQLVHYDHSNFLHATGGQEDRMNESARGWEHFPGFNSNVVFNDYRNLDSAIANFKQQAEAGSENNILTYCCGGPMEVPWRRINAVEQNKRRFIRVVSHNAGRFNDVTTAPPEMTHDWNALVSSFEGDGVEFVHIHNQNDYLGNDCSDWDFLNNMPDSTCIPAAAWSWMKSRDEKNGDVSDCGMAWYVCSGDQDGTPSKFEERFKNPVCNGAVSAVRAGMVAGTNGPTVNYFTSGRMLNISVIGISGNYFVSVTNLLNRVLYKGCMVDGRAECAIGPYATGSYLMHIESNNQKISRKILLK